jgi:hypothetical protein
MAEAADFIVEHYTAWLTVMVWRVTQENITHAEVDALCGLADGQYEKLTRKSDWADGARRAGPYVMFAMANNLGYDIIVRENPEKLARMRERAVKRKYAKPIHPLGKHPRSKDAPRDRIIRHGADQVRLYASRGGYARAAKLSKAKRRRIAKNAALIRWSDVKAAARPANAK